MVTAPQPRTPTEHGEVGGARSRVSGAPELAGGWSIAAVVIVCVAGVTIAGASGLLSSASRIVVYLLANLILTIDVIDLVVRLWVQRLHGATSPGPSIDLGLTDISNAERAAALQPYAIIASVHDEADDLDRFLTTLISFKDRVWLIDDASGDGTLLRLRRAGWNCLAGTVNRNKPAALRHLLPTLPAEIQTIVVMDPDVNWAAPGPSQRAALERVISDLQRSGAAALTPRVTAAPGGWLVECQALEYELACGLGRRSLGEVCCNSGVSIYRRSALEYALAHHSLSIYAEDFENSLLLLAAGERIYYDDRMVIETRAKTTWGGLFSQRVGWAFGCGRVFVERLPQLLAVARRGPLAAYQYLIYLGFAAIVMLPLKLLSVAILTLSFAKGVDNLLLTDLIPSSPWSEPLLFALWYGKCALVLLLNCFFTLRRGERARHLLTLPVYPVYALLPYPAMAIGFANLVTLKALGWRLFADHYEPRPTLGRPVATTAAELR
jgi:cellulose synthase/poly-beta-1,6-N-acetylglucosamine synthase-like glycosyltransferase